MTRMFKAMILQKSSECILKYKILLQEKCFMQFCATGMTMNADTRNRDSAITRNARIQMAN